MFALGGWYTAPISLCLPMCDISLDIKFWRKSNHMTFNDVWLNGAVDSRKFLVLHKQLPRRPGGHPDGRAYVHYILLNESGHQSFSHVSVRTAMSTQLSLNKTDSLSFFVHRLPLTLSNRTVGNLSRTITWLKANLRPVVVANNYYSKNCCCRQAEYAGSD